MSLGREPSGQASASPPWQAVPPGQQCALLVLAHLAVWQAAVTPAACVLVCVMVCSIARKASRHAPAHLRRWNCVQSQDPRRHRLLCCALHAPFFSFLRSAVLTRDRCAHPGRASDHPAAPRRNPKFNTIFSDASVLGDSTHCTVPGEALGTDGRALLASSDPHFQTLAYVREVLWILFMTAGATVGLAIAYLQLFRRAPKVAIYGSITLMV